MKKIKLAVFYPWIKSRGGAEKVILEILKVNPFDIDIYTWVYDKDNTFEEFKKYKINVIAPKFAEKISKKYALRGLFLPLSLFSKIPLEKYDKFIILTSGVGEFITFRNYKKNNTYAYVFTPLRASDKTIINWNLKHRYKNFFSRQKYLLLTKIYGIFERLSWKRIDNATFISELSKERAIERKLLRNKKSSIVYPLFDLKELQKNRSPKKDFFLYVSRFSPDKRHKILIEAWKKFVKNNPKEKLVLAGSIENKKYFDEILKISENVPNLIIKKNVSPKELKELYSKCKAGIFIPFMEDFGIVPFEVLASGKPLITVDKGGFVKLIENNKGVFFIKEQEDQKMINDLIKNFEEIVNKKNIKVEKVVIENFGKKIKKILTER